MNRMIDQIAKALNSPTSSRTTEPNPGPVTPPEAKSEARPAQEDSRQPTSQEASAPQPPTPAGSIAGPLGLECDLAVLPVGGAESRVPVVVFEDKDQLYLAQFWGLQVKTTVEIPFNSYQCDLTNFGSTALINVVLEFEWTFQGVQASGSSGEAVSQRKRILRLDKTLLSTSPYRFWAINFERLWLNFKPTGAAQAQRVDSDMPQLITLRQTGTPMYMLAPRAVPTP